MVMELKNIVRAEMIDSAKGTEPLTYNELHELEDKALEEAMSLQSQAIVTVTFPDEPEGQRIGRLSHLVRKLSGMTGYDISEIIDDGFLQEGDLA